MKDLKQLLIDYQETQNRLERIKAGDITAYSKEGKELLKHFSEKQQPDFREAIAALLNEI